MTIYEEAFQLNKLLFCRLSSVTLHSLNSKGIIESSGTGCIINYQSKKILITVAHNLFNSEKKDAFRRSVGIKIGISPDFQSTEYRIPNYNWLEQIIVEKELTDADIEKLKTSNNKTDTIDFAYAFLPNGINPRDEQIDYKNMKVYFIDKNVIETDLNANLSTNEAYFFSGYTKTEINHTEKKFSSVEKYVENIKYLYTSRNSSFHCFELPTVIKDNRELKGCSGAPIFNMQGKLVSLFAKSYINTNRILGINLGKIKTVVDISLIEGK